MLAFKYKLLASRLMVTPKNLLISNEYLGQPNFRKLLLKAMAIMKSLCINSIWQQNVIDFTVDFTVSNDFWFLALLILIVAIPMLYENCSDIWKLHINQITSILPVWQWNLDRLQRELKSKDIMEFAAVKALVIVVPGP